MAKQVTGLNVQWPWSQKILSGAKTIETRSYPIPEKHLNKILALVETPGRKGRKYAGINSARIIGLVIFSESFPYKSKRQWMRDRNRHLVSEFDDQFSFNASKRKWGWKIRKVVAFKQPRPAPRKKGIVFCNGCVI